MNRPKPYVALLLALLVFACSIPVASQTGSRSSAPADGSEKPPRLDFVPGEILVRFRNETQAKTVERSIMSVRSEGRSVPVEVQAVKGVELVKGLRIARVAPTDTLAAIRALNERADVLYAEPNYVRRGDRLPNDPRFSELWALKNVPQQGQLPGEDIDAETAWNTTTGSRDVVVGVVDEGIDVSHEDLQDNIWKNPGEIAGNGTDDDGNGFIDDVNGWDFFHNDKTVFDGTPASNETDAHGTHVAGTVGATGDNGKGVVGVNWQVSIMSLKILGRDDETPAPGNVWLTVQAYGYAKMMRELWMSSGGTRGANLRVLNNSYGGVGSSQAELDAIKALGQAGILFIASAGNAGANNDRSPHYPSSYNAPNLIAVAATDRLDRIGRFSSFGSQSVHMAAPGDTILSTTPNNTYEYFDGTSMAAPHVSGTAALICAASPGISVERLRAALLYSGDEVAALSPTSLIGANQTGRRLNAANALQNIVENDQTAPSAVGNFSIGGQTGRSITLNLTAPGDDVAAGRAAVYELRFSDTDLTAGGQFAQATMLTAPLPAAAGTNQNFVVKIPYRHSSGFIAIRAIDNVGNAGAITSIPVSVPVADADPYLMSQSAAQPLSTGGTAVGLVGDEKLKQNYFLPFNFPFYDGLKPNAVSNINSVTISTNGVIYLSVPPPQDQFGNAIDPFSSVTALNKSGHKMIAGMWDDLRTDRRPGDDVYVVQPDSERIIFRWQAVTYNTPLGNGTSRGENPVSFEVELRRDGTILTRYGAGNQNLFPVVGISDGDPDAYLVDSHTSGFALTSLENAQTVTFTPRNPKPPPSADIHVSNNTFSDFVLKDQQITYSVGVGNRGPEQGGPVVVKFPVPAGTTFVSCEGCNGAAPDAGGVVNVTQSIMPSNFSTSMTITVKVTAQPGTTITSTVTASGPLPDPNPADNAATARAVTVLNELTLPPPTFSPDGGIYDSAVDVKLNYNGPDVMEGLPGGVFIYYTTNGLEPDQTSFAVRPGGTVRIDKSAVLKARAIRFGWTSSSVRTAAYTIGSTNTGKQIAFTSNRDGNNEIYLMGADGSGPVNATKLSSSDIDPAWSPSGMEIVFSTNFFSSQQRLYIMNADGTPPYNPITEGDARDTEPAWSPGGGLIAFTRERGNSSQIWLVARSGALSKAQITNVPGRATSPAWSPDGQKIAFVNYVTPENPEIYVMNADGSNQVRITSNAARDISPAWSSDGKKIAFTSDRDGNYEIYSMDADGTKQTRLTNNTALDDAPAWSPDGTRIAFHSDRNGGETNRKIYVMNADGTSQTALSSGAGRDSSPSWRPVFAQPLTPPSVGFSLSSYEINELILNTPQGFTAVTVGVTRTGDTSAAATVQYSTFDPSGGNECNQAIGMASQRCDYAAVGGTLRFAPGEASKQFQIPIITDGYKEGWESFTIRLKNPAGATLRDAVALILVVDPAIETTGANNPYLNNNFFVRMNYLDFLGREPDAEGWNTWPGVLNSCGPEKGFLGAPFNCDRAHVSHGFFASPEFTDKGFRIYRMYEVGMNRLPRYDEFIPDMAALSGHGVPASVEEQNLQDYLQQFTARQEFINRFSDALQPAQAETLILKLEQTAKLTLPATATQRAGQPPQYGRAELIQKRASGQFTVGQTLKAFIEQQDVYDLYFPRGFVTMQYFAYLRRDPDLNDPNLSGWTEWVYVFTNGGATRGRPDILPRDYHHLIFGFIYSEEYRKRFGAP